VKIAIAGKGGSGKTSIAGTMARLFGREGKRVLAIDGDSNPNLALTLGISAERMNDVPTLPRDLLRRTDDGPKLTRTVGEVRSSHSLRGPDGVTLLVMAHPHPEEAGTGCLCGMHATVRTLIETASDDDADITVLDTEASPEHLTRGTAKYADAMLTVVEPYFKSLETGRRMAALARDLGVQRVLLVANKVRDDSELEAVRELAERHDLELLGAVPYDQTFPEAERAEEAPLDHAPQGAAVRATAEIAARLVEGWPPGNGAAVHQAAPESAAEGA
jgi:CO dehydrogenase maturation factor